MFDILPVVKRTVAGFGMLQSGEVVVVGVSGGPDSMALLHVLVRLAPELGLEVHAVHINHNLREAAATDVGVVEDFCRNLGVTLAVFSEDVRSRAEASGDSLEMAGRAIRYGAFTKRADSVGASRIAVGHNSDDLVETVMLNVIKGAGTDGLGGIPPVRWVRAEGSRRLAVIRPLLEVPRSDIEAYCRAWQLTPLLDSSNYEDAYLRNRVRNRLLPLIEEGYNPGFRRAICRMARVVSEENALLTGLAEQKYEEIVCRRAGAVSLACLELASQHLALQRRLLRLAVAHFGRLPSFERLERLRLLVDAPGGTVVELGGGVTARVFRGRIELTAAHEGSRGAWEEWSFELRIPGHVDLPGRQTMSAEVLDDVPALLTCAQDSVFLEGSLVGDSLVVRSRRPGDRFVPFGRRSLTKVKDFLIDVKVDRAERSVVPIVESKNGICWVGGLRADDRFRAGPHSLQVVQLVLRDFSGGPMHGC